MCGIDPGPCNMGVCVIDAISGETKVAELVHLVESHKGKTKKEGRVQTEEVVGALRDTIKMGGELRRMVGNNPVFLEDQAHTISQQQLAIQHGMQMALGTQQCITVQPAAIKHRWPNYFPVNKEHNKSKRYRQHKKNAVTWAHQFMTPAVWNAFQKKGGKMDDVCDAFWVAMFGAERIMRENYKRGDWLPKQQEVVIDLTQRKKKKKKYDISDEDEEE